YNGKPLAEHANWLFSLAPVSVGLLGIMVAWLFYGKANPRPVQIQQALGPVYRLIEHKFYMDELYRFVTRNIIFGIIGKLSAWFDRNIVDGLVNAVAKTTEWISEKIKYLQSGRLQQYAVYFLAAVLIIVWVWMKWMN
ncbi:MAG TPA: hypothetical protein PKK69_11280, partial [Ferruginibacter sp.]|nr:hypothetical protein [Ferruginibacter sp.]